MSKQRKIIRTKRIYKRKRTKSKALSTIVFILFLFVLVGFGFIVKGEWSKRFGPNAPKPSSNTSSDYSESKPSSLVSSGTNSKPDTSDSLKEIKAAYLPSSQLAQHSADQFKAVMQKFKTDGYNAVYVELKTPEGKIYYNTQNESAKKFNAVAENPIDLNVLVKAMKDAGLKPLAQMSALKDGIAPHVKNENSYAFGTTLTTNWLDNSVDKGGKPWLNPYMDKARSYICDLTKELSTAGFEAIVLDNVMFPEKNTGKLNLINENKPKPEILKQLLQEAQTAAGKAKVLQGINIEVFANVNASGYSNQASAISYTNLSPIINMEVVKAKLPEIKTAAQIEGSETDIVKAILQKIQSGNKDVQFMPVIKQSDLTVLEPILKELKIENYILM
ncbi:putative glycoside hydrolase [Paludicola sp. MB14-C6]|uniref:putative glycoside hydrolase n=1 Tax=Paludihabitans sp. MB14-C6 TaxID=3070656 RepID=UPI0027DE2117|nr:putative glycoside hydrolase [Paludicola sp. MB14-C6]WMJ23801.1 putative glycoside hydrolase [Paludicola sp. MB14-C6]